MTDEDQDDLRSFLDADNPFGFDFSALLDETPEGRAEAVRLVAAMRTPLTRGDPRRHHFIPQHFLRRFADGDQIMRVPLADPTNPNLSTVADVAVMKDFYTTVDSDIGPTVVVERILAQIEAEAARPIERLATAVLFPPQARDRSALAVWLGMLYTRGPGRRREIEAMGDMAAKMQLSMAATSPESALSHIREATGRQPMEAEVEELLHSAANFGEWEFDVGQNFKVAQMLESGMRLAALIHRPGWYWAVVKFDEDGLVLPDEPMMLYQRPENRSPFLGVGFATADEIWLPLDRRTALILHHDPAVGDRVIGPIPGLGVDEFNSTIVGSARRELYCHPADVNRLDGLLLPDGRRPIVSVSGGWLAANAVDGMNSPPERTTPKRFRPSEHQD